MPPIIMIHGAFCGGWVFDAFKAPFESAGHTCLAIDLPAHEARSSRSDVSGLSMSQYASAVCETIEGCAAPPILLGHSMGGLVAAMAAQHAKVSGLIMLAPSAPWGITGVTMEEGASAIGLYGLGAYWLQAIESDPRVAGEFSLKRMEPAARAAVLERMAPESGRALWEIFNWWLDPFMTTQLTPAAIDSPVLVLAGRHDRIHPPATVKQTASLLGAEFQVFEQMSHWLIGEPGWPDVARACLDWMAREARAAA